MLHRLIKRRSSRKQRALASAHPETLEPRILLTGQIEAIPTNYYGRPIDLDTSNYWTGGLGTWIHVFGTEGDDRVIAHYVEEQLTITSLDDSVTLPVQSASEIEGTVLFQHEAITHVRMWGGLGNDYLHNMTDLDCKLNGNVSMHATSGSFELITEGSWDGKWVFETMDGSNPTKDGNDIMIGGGGDDILLASYGNDILFGGGGDDLLRGEAGDDVLDGGLGDDNLTGDDGDDVLDGGPGDD
ncbi:MAG: hypothetical protein ABGZ17_01025, partial [Planctomycetaceae bacterium]